MATEGRESVGARPHHHHLPEGEGTVESRRRFLKLMGASLGLAGMAGCIRLPEEKLAPYAHRPHNRTPGAPVHYATAMEIGGIAQGLLVTSIDGRPIKIEGNPTHPLNQGACDAIAQASILELYDPDRSRGVIRRDADGTRKEVGWDEFARWAKDVFKGDGSGICVLSEASSSLSLEMMRHFFTTEWRPKVEWFEYEPISDDAIRVGSTRAMVLPCRPVLELSRARVIVSLDADLFGCANPLAVKHARDFAAGRPLQGPNGNEMNRLYVVESVHSISGACADHRRALRSGAIAAFVGQLARALNADPWGLANKDVDSGIDKAFLDAVKADLEANTGRSVVVAGWRQPPQVHALVAAINDRLGNLNKTVVYYRCALEKAPPSQVDALRALVKKMNSGEVKTLLILGGNPVYNAPADLSFAEALKRVTNTVHLGLHDDDTSHVCTWHLSRAHYLESWGDARAYDSALSIVQPLIEPLFDGRSAAEVLAMVLDRERLMPSLKGYDIVRDAFQGEFMGFDSEFQWKKALADGVAEDSSEEPTTAVLGHDRPAGKIAGPPPLAEGEYEVVFFPDAKVYDGRFANNGWLQELPDPMTRLTWDNAALMNPKTAEAIGCKQDEMVALQAGDSPEVLFPAYFVPGMADGVIGLALGYGRTAAGNIGNGVGQNAYLLRTSDNLGWRTGVKARATGQMYKLATVQDHHIIDAVGKKAVQERIPELIHEMTLAECTHHAPRGGEHHAERGEYKSIFDEHKLDGRAPGGNDHHRWGMAVDLTSCTGCGACVVACQAENNIPIVGKEQVLHGREMHWIRIDRYFKETPPEKGDSPRSVHQPVLCMHCENAPCEQVCPVAATTHSQEGINMMTYNRCVGTRYCSNNCPYKVRRFNFFDYNRGTLKDLYMPNLEREPITELLKMQKNPEVTVRMRGVMEKCNYCIQRIEATRIKAKNEGDRPIRDGEIQTACQQTCPAQALVFGDLNDPNSRVSKLQGLARSYGMLDEQLNTKPRTVYLAKVRNPAPGPGKTEGEKG